MKWTVRCECGREQVKASASFSAWRGYCVCTGGRPDHVHSLYGTWANMKHRCFAKNSKNFPVYGGRGITVCERWLGRDGFSNFVDDVGVRPPGSTLDRIDPNGNYEPNNVRWANAREQVANRRCSVPRIAAIFNVVDEYLRVNQDKTYAGADVLAVLKQLILG